MLCLHFKKKQHMMFLNYLSLVWARDLMFQGILIVEGDVIKSSSSLAAGERLSGTKLY